MAGGKPVFLVYWMEMNTRAKQNGIVQHKYPPSTVGHRMVVDVPIVHEKHTLAEVRAVIERHSGWFNTINYIYVLDDDRKLTGVLSIRDLFLHPAHAVAKDVCKSSSLVTVRPHAHQERGAYLALKNNIKAVPVVDEERRFLGELPNDAIMTIMYTEMHEDALRMAGITHEGGTQSNVLTLSLFSSFKHRILWLIIGLAGGLLTANIIGAFEETIAENLILAAFLPLIVYMSSAVGTQMQSYVIRDLAVDHKLPFAKYLARNIVIVIAIAIVLGLLLAAATTILHNHPQAGIAIGIALVGSTMSSVLTGLLLPYGFSKFSLDPADVSGPVATIIQDIISIVIYFGVATALL
jgi:magnesium transporter